MKSNDVTTGALTSRNLTADHKMFDDAGADRLAV